jgi:hypothetical protein
MKQGSTGLTIRELQVYRKPAIELTTKNISQWVEHLPAANLGESAQSIYRLLVDANQTIVEPEKRLAILNIIEPAALKVANSLERQFVNNHISLTEKQRKIAALVQAIQTEISIGYHAVIESVISEGVKRSTRKILANAIYQALKYHGLVILRCFQLYASVPGRVWRELYHLYQMSRDHQIETLEIKLTNSSNLSNSKNLFVQIMLLATANPYQLRQSEIELVWDILPDYVEFCSMEAHAFSKNPFFINLNSNLPPTQKSLYRNQVDENKLKISVVALLEKLKIDLAQVSENAKYSARKTMVFKHLIHCWSQGTQRSFARTSCHDDIDVSIGLGATHYLLTEYVLAEQDGIGNDLSGSNDDSESDTQTLDAMEGSLKDATIAVVADKKNNIDALSNRDYLSTSAIADKDVWAKLYRPDQAVSSQEEDKTVSLRSRDSIVRDSYKVQTSQLVNMSPGGYCIQIASSELPKHAQTGEIIGFIEGEGIKQHWSIGVVRWVRRRVKGNYIQMGVQLLAPNVLPISIQLRNSRSDDNNFQRALLLPALTGVGQAATIITNPLAFNINNKLKVSELNRQYEVRLTKEINSSGSSRQFSFEEISSSTTPTNKNNAQPSASQDDLDDMDGIWDLI